MIYNLFPTPVGHYKIERDLTRAELKFINKQEKKQNEGVLDAHQTNFFDEES